MRATTALVLSLLLLAGALTGCLGGSDDPGSDVDPSGGADDDGADGNGTGNQTDDGGYGDGDGNATTTTPGGPGTASVTVEARDLIATGNGSYSYDTERIEVPLGATVNLTLTSHDMNLLPHDLVIDELGVATDTINSGETTTVTFVADQAGEFAFYCSIGDHRDRGMEGLFVVME